MDRAANNDTAWGSFATANTVRMEYFLCTTVKLPSLALLCRMAINAEHSLK